MQQQQKRCKTPHRRSTTDWDRRELVILTMNK